MDINTILGLSHQITAIVEYICAIIVALLALDNAVDALAKFFGNKEIDTLCGKFALYLNNLMIKLKVFQAPAPVTPVVAPQIIQPIPAVSGTSSTVTATTGVVL